LDIYPHRVHVGQSGFDLCQLGESLGQHEGVVVVNGGLSHGASRDLGFRLLFRPASYQILDCQRQSMAVKVDSQVVVPAPAGVDPPTRFGFAARQAV
jgi:hypothetical protein